MAADWRSMLSAEEVPTSDLIARAIVAAARVLDEDPMLFATPGAERRSVKVAFHVINQFYPLFPKTRLGIAMGLTHQAGAFVQSAMRSPWWNERRDAFAAVANVVEAA